MVKYVQQHIITEFDLGVMQFHDDNILLVKSSEVIDLYQIQDVEDNHMMKSLKDNLMPNQHNVKNVKWTKYHTLFHKGFAQVNTKSNRF